MKTIAIYPGRFQPAGIHHYNTYKWIASKFGKSNTYVVTSDKVDPPKSPLNFKEKAMVWKKHGVKNVTQVKNPYVALELLKDFDQDDTIVVFVFGEKDAQRFSGGKKKDGSLAYLQPYDKFKNDLKPFKEHAYFMTAPHFSLKVNGKDISGTQIRTILGSSKLDEDTKKTLFEKIFGWYDDKIFKFLTKKFEASVNEAVLKNRRTQFISEYNNILNDSVSNDNRELLLCGGAFGHLANIYDDYDLTFSDLKNIARLGLEGKLEKVSEKTDGQNIMVSWKNGKLIISRNKGHLKNFGAAALDVDGLKDMFKGRGDLETAFGQAGEDLQKALKNIPAKKLTDFFQEGKIWMNLEVMYPATQNVIPYGLSVLMFHGTLEYDESGEVIGAGGADAAKTLKQAIDNVNSNIQDTYSIIGPKDITLVKAKDFSKRQAYYINKIDKLKNEFNLSDSDSVLQYYVSSYDEIIAGVEKEFGFNLPSHVREGLLNRWAKFDKSFSLTDVKKELKNDTTGILAWIMTFDKQNHKKSFKTLVKPFDEISLELGTEILMNASDYLAANKDEALQAYRDEIEKTIAELKKQNDMGALEKVEAQLSRIATAGGLDKLAPTEGIVFDYNGKLFKFTGLFAPVNQLLGMFKFSR